MRHLALAVIVSLLAAGSGANANDAKRERIRDRMNDLTDAQPSLAVPAPPGDLWGQAGYALDGMLFAAGAYQRGGSVAGVVAEHFDGDAFAGVWGGATVLEQGYVELRGLAGNGPGLAELRAEWSIPVAANAAVTAFGTGTYAEEERVAFTRGEAGAGIGVRTELLDRQVGFRAGFSGIDANAYDARLRVSAGATMPLGMFRLTVGGRYTTGVSELGVGGAVRIVF